MTTSTYLPLPNNNKFPKSYYHIRGVALLQRLPVCDERMWGRNKPWRSGWWTPSSLNEHTFAFLESHMAITTK